MVYEFDDEIKSVTMRSSEKTPRQILLERHGPASTGAVISVSLTIFLSIIGFRGEWEASWVFAAMLGVLLIFAVGTGLWLYGGLVHACGMLHDTPVAVKARGSDDLDLKDDISIFFEGCEIAEQAKVVVRVLDATDFRVLGTGVLHGRTDLLSRVLIETPAPGSGDLLTRLKSNNSDVLKKLRVTVDHGYANPRTGKVHGDNPTDSSEP